MTDSFPVTTLILRAISYLKINYSIPYCVLKNSCYKNRSESVLTTDYISHVMMTMISHNCRFAKLLIVVIVTLTSYKQDEVTEKEEYPLLAAIITV